ncbi:MAG: TRAP transporter small permease [Gammaproteobacteria bacterium]
MLRLLNRIAWGFALAGGVVALAIAVAVVASIAGRATVSAPIPGDVELTQFGIALAISLSLPWCQLHGSNIMVDFFTQRLRARHVAWLDALGALLLAAMAALLSWRAAVGAIDSRQTFEATMILDLPMWWVYASLAPGLALTALIALVQAALLAAGRDLTGFRA